MDRSERQREWKDAPKPATEPSELAGDSVRADLRNMSRLPPLTGEQEVELAELAEQGERAVVRAILRSPIGAPEILRFRQALVGGTLRAAAIVRDAADEGGAFDEDETKRR